MISSFLQEVHMYKIAENLQIIAQTHTQLSRVLRWAERLRKPEDSLHRFKKISLWMITVITQETSAHMMKIAPVLVFITDVITHTLICCGEMKTRPLDYTQALRSQSHISLILPKAPDLNIHKNLFMGNYKVPSSLFSPCIIWIKFLLKLTIFRLYYRFIHV